MIPPTHPILKQALLFLSGTLDDATGQILLSKANHCSYSDQLQTVRMLKPHKKVLKLASIELPTIKAVEDYLKQFETLQVIPTGADAWDVRNEVKGTAYEVTKLAFDGFRCTCPIVWTQPTCKHIEAVESYLEASPTAEPDGDEYIPDVIEAPGTLDERYANDDIRPAIIAPQPKPKQIIQFTAWQDVRLQQQQTIDSLRNELTPQQQQAFDFVLTWYEPGKRDRPFVFSGYSGTGKSFASARILKALLLKYPGLKVAIAAPTQKAVQVAADFADKAGLKADVETIHALLHLSIDAPDEYGVRRLVLNPASKKPFMGQFDLVVVDERSMLGSEILGWMIVADHKQQYLDDLFGQLAPVERDYLGAIEIGDYRGFSFIKDQYMQLRKAINAVIKNGWRPDHNLEFRLQHGSFLAPTLLLGDSAQLPPNSNESHDAVSPIDLYFDSDVELTDVVRYSGEIIQFATEIRSDLSRHSIALPESGGNISTLTPAQWEQEAIAAFAKGATNIRVLAWKNDRVSALNKAIRDRVQGIQALHPFLPGEVLIAKDAIELPDPLQPEKTQAWLRACDEVTVLESKPTSLHCQGHDIDCHQIKVTDVDGRIETIYAIPQQSESWELLRYILRQLKASIHSEPDPQAKRQGWTTYYSILNQFSVTVTQSGQFVPKLQYVYAATVNSSQGSTYDQVFLDSRNVQQCRSTELRNRLLYVGATRASQHLHLVR